VDAFCQPVLIYILGINFILLADYVLLSDYNRPEIMLMFLACTVHACGHSYLSRLLFVGGSVSALYFPDLVPANLQRADANNALYWEPHSCSEV
jgi:hypothetical protein